MTSEVLALARPGLCTKTGSVPMKIISSCNIHTIISLSKHKECKNRQNATIGLPMAQQARSLLPAEGTLGHFRRDSPNHYPGGQLTSKAWTLDFNNLSPRALSTDFCSYSNISFSTVVCLIDIRQSSKHVTSICCFILSKSPLGQRTIG